jgi:arsenate reductase
MCQQLPFPCNNSQSRCRLSCLYYPGLDKGKRKGIMWRWRVLLSKLKILFLCTGNSCRSQMAEGLTRHLKSDLIEVCSAGIETHGLNPHAVAVMAEEKIDISLHKSQHLNDFKHIHFDYVITVCSNAHESCPIFPGNSKIIHAGFDDPPKMAEQFSDPKKKLDCYRKVRDQIKSYVLTLPECLANTGEKNEP